MDQFQGVLNNLPVSAWILAGGGLLAVVLILARGRGRKAASVVKDWSALESSLEPVRLPGAGRTDEPRVLRKEARPPRIEGLEFVHAPDEPITVRFTAPATDAFRELLLWLPEGWEIDFHDQHYPTGEGDDPGAHVSIQRKREAFRYFSGNQGWSSGWKDQDLDFLIKLLHANLTPPEKVWAKPFDKLVVRGAARSAWTGRPYR